MSFDVDALRRAVAAHGRVARVVVAEVAGSAPREVGAAMLVWQEDGRLAQSGTIGGGALEYEAAAQAFRRSGATRHPLGPALGQCCGGAVTLWTEQWDADSLEALAGKDVIARPPEPAPGPAQNAPPLAVRRILDRARARGLRPVPQLVDGWMVEPVRQPGRDLWIWGAGHVGRALVDVLAPLPDWRITWVDTAPERFPETLPAQVTRLPAARPDLALPRAPQTAAHLILTYSHALDLALCHAALSHGFGFCGLIGSATKWARFSARLRALGHNPAQIDTICCPIGQKELGKHPQAIAIGVARQLMTLQTSKDAAWTTVFSASRA